MVNKKYVVSIVISVLSLLAIVFVVVNIFNLSSRGMRTEEEMNRFILFIIATGVFILALIFVIAILIRNYRKSFIKFEDDEDLSEIEPDLLDDPQLDPSIKEYIEKEKSKKEDL